MSNLINKIFNIFQDIGNNIANYILLGTIGFILGIYLQNRTFPEIIESAQNLRTGIGYIGMILVLAPVLDKFITKNNMIFTVLLCCCIGGILISWSFAVSIYIPF